MKARVLSWVALSPFLWACRSHVPAADVTRAADVSTVGDLSGAPRQSLDRPLEVLPSEDLKVELSRPLGEADVVRLALSQNREIQAALAEVGIARGQWMQAGTLPNPTFEVEIPAEEDAKLGLGLEFDITDALLAPARARAFAPSLEASRINAARAALQVGAKARIAFARVWSAERQLELALLVQETFAAELDAVTAAHEAGNVPDLDLAERRLSYEFSRLEVQRLRVEVATRRGDLAATLGLAKSDAALSLSEAPFVVPEREEIPANLEEKVLGTSLDLSLSRAKLDALGSKTGYVRARGNTPDIELGARAHLSRREDAPFEDEWTFGAGLSTTLPLFNRQVGNLRAAEAEFDATLRRHIALAAKIRTEAQVLAERLARVHETAKLLHGAVLPAAEERVEQLLLQYNAMQVDVLALVGGRRAELLTQMEATRVEEEYIVTRALYRALTEGCLVQEGARFASSSTPADESEGH